MTTTIIAATYVVEALGALGIVLGLLLLVATAGARSNDYEGNR